MCGFLGEFLFRVNDSTSDIFFKELLELSKHRGPDSTKIVATSKFKLGFNRLSILDITSNADQPKLSPSKRYYVVFNGEIYNFKELEEKYDLCDLNSSSDTEVLIHLLDKIGIEQTIKELNGMFAIAIIDSKLNELYLTRDFAGIKPLFYGISHEGAVFASQFNQIHKHSFFNLKLKFRKEILKEYFGLGYMQAPNTIFEKIYQVNPGELIKISANGEIFKEVLWSFNPLMGSYKSNSKENCVNEFDKMFGEVIKRQLQSDVPLAAFLSGGIDSPLVCAQAKKQKEDIETFTIGVEHKKYDESIKASQYANHLNAEHTIKQISSDQLIEQIDEHFKYFSEPFGDFSSIPTYVITKIAKDKHTVMLSGDGGDELFFGYPRMLDIFKKRYWFKVPYLVRKPVIRLAIKLKLFNSWAPYTYRKMEDSILAKHLHISLNKLNKLFPKSSFSIELKEIYRLPKNQTKKKLLHWLRFNEFYAHMQRVLIKVDRMSMANSLEVRVPFLDKKSIDFAWKIIPEFSKNKFELKGLLKKAMELYYPKEMIEKEKSGFSVPIDDWLKNHLKNDVKKVIFDYPIYGEAYLNKVELINYVEDYFEEKHNESWGVWHIYAWQKWALNEKLINS